MFSRRTLHLLATSAIFLFLFSRLAPGIYLFLSPRADKSNILPEELFEQNSTLLVPPIIHQVYHNWGHGEIDARWLAARQTCIDLHPDYDFILWNDTSSRALLKEFYPWFVSTYDSYKYPVQRVDVIRLFVLLHMGGIYIDLDQGCRRRLDPLRRFAGFVSGNQRSSGISNGIMACTPGHPWLAYLTEILRHHNWNWISPYLTVVSSTGSHMLSFAWMTYQHLPASHSDAGEMRKCLPHLCGVGDNAFFVNGPGNTWHEWDARFFLWESDHPLLATVMVNVPAIFGLSFLLWQALYTTWKLIRALYRSFGRRFKSVELLL